MESTEPAGTTGGKLYDEGGYGCVFTPPLLCKGEKKPKKMIVNHKLDKLMLKDSAEFEYSIAQRVHGLPLWKNYFVVADSICTPASFKKQTDTTISNCSLIGNKTSSHFRLLRMNFGGVPLSKAIIEGDKNTLYDMFLHLIEAGAILNLFGIVHRDIHMDNILIDEFNVPRMIDFNLSIDIKRPYNDSFFSHDVNPRRIHESPDTYLVNGIARGYNVGDLINSYLNESACVEKISVYLKVDRSELRDQLVDFYKYSKSAKSGNYIGWFKSYWRTIDSWAIGSNILTILSSAMLWPEFKESEAYEHLEEIYSILRDMLNLNPAKRIDCVEALQRLDANNFIIRKYAGNWLEKVKTKGGDMSFSAESENEFESDDE
jgi:serine/threonine protein kinase